MTLKRAEKESKRKLLMKRKESQKEISCEVNGHKNDRKEKKDRNGNESRKID